jgi:type VI secretion system protein ImpM
MNAVRCSPGLYGKVPILGDFVSRRLPAHFVRPWDDWLQNALSASREQLDSVWLDVYLISPIWRFVLSGGICGTDAWAGVLMPSVDKVNRYFPLTLAVPIQQQAMLPSLFTARAQWFDKLEDLALSALDDGLDLEGFDRELQGNILNPFSVEKARHSAPQGGRTRETGLSFHIGMGEMSRIRDAFVHLSACMLGEFLPIYSLWCTNGSEWVEPSLVAYDGLPPAAAYAELLTGCWKQGEWDEWIASRSSTLKSHREAAVTVREPDGAADAKRLCWRSNACTTVGCVRKVNEDNYIERRDTGLWAVADGVGGHEAGEVASKAVVDALGGIPAADSLEAMIDAVKACLENVNQELLEKSKEYGFGKSMGSTAVILLAMGDRCAAVWVGDSRLYRYRDGVFLQITKDHSLAAELSRMGAGDPEELATGKMGNLLTRALGCSSRLEIEAIVCEAREGDMYVLCSDGMIREVKDREIGDILDKSGLEDSPRKLIDLALDRGARDNVTVVVASVGSIASGGPMQIQSE